MSITKQPYPQLQSHTHKTLCVVYESGWGKWQPFVFDSVTQFSCIYNFCQCLDFILPAKASLICHLVDTQLSRTSLVLKGFSCQKVVVFFGKKLIQYCFKIISGSITCTVNEMSIQTFYMVFLLKLPTFIFTHHTFLFISVISFSISHVYLCITIHRGEKYCTSCLGWYTWVVI